MFFRSHESYLSSWISSVKRKPLVLRGARQVGKSALVQNWAQKQGYFLVEVNFEIESLHSLQQNDIRVENVIRDLELRIGRKLNPSKDLLFFDEIQKSPKAFLSLRYFYERFPQFAVIAAGSLLDFLFLEKELSVPVGRLEFHYMGPVTFSEFLFAQNNSALTEEFKKPTQEITDGAYPVFLEQYRIYQAVGGMPEAVQSYVSDKDFNRVRKIHLDLLRTFASDFIKYSKRKQVDRCEKVFRYLPGHIGEKVKYVEIDPDLKSRELKAAIDLLEMARVFLKVKHTNATRLPLEAFEDERIFKLYFLDVGLVTSAMNESIETLLHSNSVLTGGLAEQFVAQHLGYLDPLKEPSLFYWLREKKHTKAELDFVYPAGDKIIPIEVKGGLHGKLRSLHAFMEEHPDIPMAIKLSSERFSRSKVKLIPQVHRDVRRKAARAEFDLVTLPVWAVEKIREIA